MNRHDGQVGGHVRSVCENILNVTHRSMQMTRGLQRAGAGQKSTNPRCQC